MNRPSYRLAASSRGGALLALAVACGVPASSVEVGGYQGERVLSRENYSHSLEFQGGGRIDEIAVAISEPAAEPALTIRFRASGFEGRLAPAMARVGVLAGPALARQEVRHDGAGQPADPRTRWSQSVELEYGSHQFELPVDSRFGAATAWAVIELRSGGRVLPVVQGPRSEMLEGGARVEGGRGILGSADVPSRVVRVRAARVGGDRAAVKIDGSLDDAAWAAEGTALRAAVDGEPLAPSDLHEQMGVDGPTVVWFAWDADFLYVAGELPDADLYADQREQDDHLWERENFEIFVAGTDRGSRYLELQVSARNVTFDAYFAEYRKGDFEWDSAWETAVERRGDFRRRNPDQGWTVEAAIPWSEICERTDARCPMEPGSELRVNVFRLEKPDRRRQMGLGLSPTFGDFHNWSGSAILELEP